MTEGGTEAYGPQLSPPPLVEAALDAAASLGFGNSCAPEQGQLLSVLARGCPSGRIGETGTGCGVGLAWMVEASGPGTSFVSIERDPERCEAARRVFSSCSNVEILCGDWAELRASGPFQLLVLDGGGKGKEPGEDPPLDPAEWLEVGGTIVLDDFVPFETADAPRHDGARLYWTDHPQLLTTELRLNPSLATLVGRRLPPAGFGNRG